MNGSGRLTCRDWLVAAGFFAVGLAMRVPFRSHYAYHWDSAQYALAILHYDMRIGLPHRPGYFLYVMAGRLVNLVLGDPHASLVWLSVVMGAALPALGFLLGTSLFGRGCGVATAVILATSPLCWFNSEVALNTIVDATLVTATVWAAWRAMQRGGMWLDVVVLAVLLSLVAGVRQQTAPVLLPAWVYAFSKFGRDWLRKLVVGVALMGVLCLLWFVPMVEWSGGFGAYLELLHKRAIVDAPLTAWGGGWSVLWDNVVMIVTSCWAGLLAAGLLAATELVLQRANREPWRRHRLQLWLLGWWIAPMLGFGVAVYTYRPDYVLCYFPALAILAGVAIARSWVMVSIVGLVNCAAFLFQTGLVLGLPVTAATIREGDRQFGACLDAIRARYRPGEVQICHANQYFFWGFRQFQYHLPEYDNWLLKRDPALAAPYTNKLWHARGVHVEFTAERPGNDNTPLLLIVPPKLTVKIFEAQLDIARAQEWRIAGCPPQFIQPAQGAH